MIEFLVGLVLSLTVLTTPYVSQRGPGADQRKYDCGGAVAAMVIEGATGIQVSVDDLMGNLADVYVTYNGMQSLVEPYGIVLGSQWFNTPDVLREYVQLQGPVLVVVVYKHLNLYAREGSWHWLWVIDADEQGFFYHDSWVGPNQYAQDNVLFAGMDATDITRIGVFIEEVRRDIYKTREHRDPVVWIQSSNARITNDLPGHSALELKLHAIEW